MTSEIVDARPSTRVGRVLPRSACALAIAVALPALGLSGRASAAGGGADPATPQPTAWSHAVAPWASIDVHTEPTLDLDVVQREDSQRERDGLPPRFAIPRTTSITPQTHGSWEQVSQAVRMWRLRIQSPGALSLNLGFTRYHLPPGAQLFLYPAQREEAAPSGSGDSDGRQPVRFTASDNAEHGQLWTPVLLTDDLIVELTLPVKETAALQLELGSVNVGYRGFGEMVAIAGVDKAGTCNVDVVCPEGADWLDEIATVGVISTGGSTFCTGFMVNNTAQDQRPYFMTANHCGISSSNAASLVVYWNFQSPTCGQQGGGSLSQFQTGSFFRSTYSNSDFTLVELDSPPDPAWEVAFAGWNRGTGDPVAATAIHHPNTDEKSISFEYDPLSTTSYLSNTVPGNGTHLRITDWDVGTTEPGSSGSPLFDPNHRVVGQLHGGDAACGNDLSDWYGRFSVSWTGGGTSSTRLSNWLDPGNTGALVLDTINPSASGLRVLPGTNLSAGGDYGGPFSPPSGSYTLENRNATSLGYSVTASVPWLTITNGAGSLAGGATTTVTIGPNAAAQTLPLGIHVATIDFVNTTDHDGDAQRTYTLQVGLPELVHSFPMDSNPGWTAAGQWAFGHPTGGGGAYGNPDPANGHTGANVFGYNLSGDYANNLGSSQNLTTTAIDCSQLQGVILKFWRWLGVESPTYDHATVWVSNNGSTWTPVWENPGYVEDAAWSQVEYDISAVADQQATVYLRWGIGPTDGSWTYCGWNIDDVEIWGVQLAPTAVEPPRSAWRTALLGNTPNPFNPMTEIGFELAADGPVRLSLFDLRGRLVRTLQNQPLAAGPHSAVWNGRDDAGQAVASGTYICRLESGGVTRQSKVTLVR